MNKKPMTPGEIAGRLAAEKIDPLVRCVERATGTKLRLGDPERPPKPNKVDKPV